jgi:hypothetical protein
MKVANRRAIQRASACMSDKRTMADIEVLARMAARLAGRNPDEHLTMSLGGVIPFHGPVWRYPDFMARAESAYRALTAASLTLQPALDGQEEQTAADSDDRMADKPQELLP